MKIEMLPSVGRPDPEGAELVLSLLPNKPQHSKKDEPRSNLLAFKQRPLRRIHRRAAAGVDEPSV